MLCKGSVDLDGRLDARIEARLLRDTMAMGKAVSLLFSPLTKTFLNTKQKETLKKPNLEPIYILPRLLQIPLTPWRSLKELFPTGPMNEEGPLNLFP